MRERSRRRPTMRWTLALIGALAGLGLAGPAAAAPVYDNYLSSLRLNDPGKPLEPALTLVDHPNTTGTSVQSDIFNPPMSGGPAEPTVCQGASYGSTIWYDFHPDRNGAVRIRASGYDNVISLMEFSQTTLLPDLAHRLCVVNLTTMIHELDAPVLAKHHYTIQIGGVGGAAGLLEFLFDFLPQITRISADAQLKAVALSTGIRIRSLSVSAPRGVRVEVRCTRGCAPQVKTAPPFTFPRLGGVRLSAGARLQIFATAPGAVGAYIEYRIRRGDFSKVTRCLAPGSRVPRVSCT
ncbi:MAG: hypothetical protein QOD61_2149 [Solirubrobacteraceae bacterium]|nr:hypothetical protein [Solirubrobacteraceae bacterium]